MCYRLMCDSQTGFEFRRQIAQLVMHLTRDQGALVQILLYPSLSLSTVTFGAMQTPGTDRVTPARGRTWG